MRSLLRTNMPNAFLLCCTGEALHHVEKYLLEHRTDGTDAFDTLYIGCEKFPQHDLYLICVGGVR